MNRSELTELARNVSSRDDFVIFINKLSANSDIFENKDLNSYLGGLRVLLRTWMGIS